MRIICLCVLTILVSCNNPQSTKMIADIKTAAGCSDDCKTTDKKGTTLACKLTTPELRQRKETVLASLQSQVVEKKELADGYAFKFPGTDKMLDELTEFIKTERECCDFFTFNLSVSGDKSDIWLELKGAKGAKEFISSELGL